MREIISGSLVFNLFMTFVVYGHREEKRQGIREAKKRKAETAPGVAPASAPSTPAALETPGKIPPHSNGKSKIEAKAGKESGRQWKQSPGTSRKDKGSAKKRKSKG